MEANGLNLEEIDKKIEEKSQQLSEIKKSITESKKIIARTEETKRDALREKRLTIGELRRFTFCKKAFEFAGIDFRNFKQFTLFPSSVILIAIRNS